MSVLIIDIGSSSVRALLFDDEAALISDAIARREHQLVTEPIGAAYFDAAPLRERVEACIDEILTHPAAQDLRAVGMDSFVGNIVGVDADNQPLTPLLSYAETRAHAQLEALRPIYEASDSHQRTGCPHHTAYLPSQLAWMRQTQPKTFDAVAQWLDIGSFLYRTWFSAPVPMSYSVASWSGLLARASLTWDATWLDALGLNADKFPPLADYNAAQTGLGENYRARWPLLAHVPFYLAVGDGAAANIGVGAFDACGIALTVGTTAALRLVKRSETPPIIPPGLWGYRVDAEQHLIGGATSEGGNIFHWLRQTFQLPPHAEEQIKARPIGGHGLQFSPLLAGERSLGWDAEATGSISGLRFSSSPLDILQAALEGVALHLKSILEALPNTEGAPILASGGALEASPVWVQIMADVFGRPLHYVDSAENTARGAALLVLSAELAQPFETFPTLSAEIIQPR